MERSLLHWFRKFLEQDVLTCGFYACLLFVSTAFLYHLGIYLSLGLTTKSLMITMNLTKTDTASQALREKITSNTVCAMNATRIKR
ncbi:hypothetical protein TYRP_007541 [Tyrophagus putrescentiae]|nr:hypothetical protein TYRP_007541 [Tyrophagus putrescentiae]